MTRDRHVRSCESGRVRFPPATHQNRMHGLTGGSWKRGALTTDTKKNDHTGNRAAIVVS
jgi:hypothetical protein